MRFGKFVGFYIYIFFSQLNNNTLLVKFFKLQINNINLSLSNKFGKNKFDNKHFYY